MSEFSAAFYEMIRDGCRSSAAVVAPIVDKLVSPRSVVDVGCGEGWWGAAFVELGCSAVGLDGKYAAPSAQIPFHVVDLESTIGEFGPFDLAVCLEVAEHLSPERAPSFVADLCRLAPTVLFSAAAPGQAGIGHINCRPPSYWARLFADHSYDGTGGLRAKVWGDSRVEWWYQQNLMLFSRLPLPLEPDGCQLVRHPDAIGD
jgi:SAM-dependent methyltransferase